MHPQLSAVEKVFQNMTYRKVIRHFRGTRESERPWTLLWVFLTILLICGVLVPNVTQETGKIDIKLNIRSVGFWSLIVVLCFFILVYTLTRVVVVVRWSLYWLLATEVMLYLWKREFNLFSENTPVILVVLFVLVEFLTFAIYLLVQYGYPALIRSSFFRTSGMLTWWYDLRPSPSAPWTYSYKGGFIEQERGRRRTCAYRGEMDADGLPHGLGNWLDDAHNGEILSGIWERGVPVGPFRSREFGTGFAFNSVRIGYVHCSDDEFADRSYFPQQTRVPTTGVATVESSISGMFFSHLPQAEILDGPYCLARPSPFDVSWPMLSKSIPGFEGVRIHHQPRTFTYILGQLRQFYTEHPSSSVIISVSEGRGVHVSGHSYVGEMEDPQTKSENKQPVKQLMIDVVEAGGDLFSLSVDPSSNGAHGKKQQQQQTDQNVKFLPKFRSSLALSLDGTQDGNESDYEETENHVSMANQNEESDTANKTTSPSIFNRLSPRASSSSLPSNSISPPITYSVVRENLPNLDAPFLRIRGWRSTTEGHAEALVFIPGFNASLEHSMQRLGQFVSLSRLPPHIKPILFSYPCGREFTYLWASEKAHSERTHGALLCLLQGLRDAGIREVHFLTHSLGVQVALSAFADDEVTGERSEVAKLFDEVGPDGHHETPHPRTQNGFENTAFSLLRARTITLLHPDYPLNEFNAFGFTILRRICDHITVIGDRRDFALGLGEIGTGYIDTWRSFAYGIQPRFLKSRNEMEAINYDASETAGEEGPKPKSSSRRRCCTGRFRDCCRNRKHGEDVLFGRKLIVGRNIFSLYLNPPRHPIPATYGAVSDPNSLQQQGLSATRIPLLPSAFEFSHRQGTDTPPTIPLQNSSSAIAPTASRKRIWLDLDAIDTTWMELNVHAMRHNHFNINPVLVEDLHELLVSGKRARERSLLLHREGNIFSYCNAPSFVMNE